MIDEALKNYHPIVYKIQVLLAKNNYWFETFEHPPVRTSEEVVQYRPKYTLHQGAKALIVKTGENETTIFSMLVLPGDMRLSNREVKKMLSSKEYKFASQEDLQTYVQGVEPGGIPPFGNLFGLSVYVDKSLIENKIIVFNAGDRRFSVAMFSDDYVKLVHPTVRTFCS